jgi:hypothetical protein
MDYSFDFVAQELDYNRNIFIGKTTSGTKMSIAIDMRMLNNVAAITVI